MTKSKTIVKITTEYYHNNKYAFVKKKLTILKRKSTGYILLLEECDNIDTEKVLSNIVNLFDVEDGVYELTITCNHKNNYQLGTLDDYSYKLVEYIEGIA